MNIETISDWLLLTMSFLAFLFQLAIQRNPLIEEPLDFQVARRLKMGGWLLVTVVMLHNVLTAGHEGDKIPVLATFCLLCIAIGDVVMGVCRLYHKAKTNTGLLA